MNLGITSRMRPHSLFYSIVIILLLGTLYTWLNTKIGLHYTVACLRYWLPGDLEITQLEGKLLGPWQAKGLYYKDTHYIIKSNHFYLNWKKSAFLKGQLCIQVLQFKDLNILIKPREHQASFSVPTLLKRLRLNQGEFSHCVFTTNNFQLQLQGIIGRYSKLNWTVQYTDPNIKCNNTHTLQLSGQLKGACQAYPQLELEGIFQDSLVWNMPFLKGSIQSRRIQIPSFRIKSSLKNSILNNELQFFEANNMQANLVSCITLPESVLHNLFHSEGSVQCDLKVFLQDWSLLKNITLLSENLLFTDIKGPITLKCHLEGPWDALQAFIKSPKQYVLEKCKEKLITTVDTHRKNLKARLSLLWQQPVIPNLGVNLHEYSMSARLQGKQIQWQSYVIAPLKEKGIPKATVGKWTLQGTTQCILDLSSQLPAWCNNLNIKNNFSLQGSAIPWFKDTAYTFWVAPNLRIQSTGLKGSIQGSVDIPKAKLKSKYTNANYSVDKDVQFSTTQPKIRPMQYALAVQVGINLGKAVHFEYENAKTRLEGSVTLKKEYDNESLSAQGAIHFVNGYYETCNQKLRISSDSKFIFHNSWRVPRIEIKASQTLLVHPRTYFLSKLPLHTLKPSMHNYALFTNTGFDRPIQSEFGLHLSGNIETPELKLFTSPPEWVSQSREDVSNMLDGQPTDRLSMSSVPILLNAATRFTIGYAGYNSILSKLNNKLGLHVELKANEALENMHILMSKNFTQKLSMAAQIGLQHSNAKLKLHYLLNDHFMIEGSVVRPFEEGIDFIYQHEYS